MHVNSLSHDCRWKTLYEDEDEDVCFARRRSFIDASVSHVEIRTESAYMHYVLYARWSVFLAHNKDIVPSRVTPSGCKARCVSSAGERRVIKRLAGEISRKGLKTQPLYTRLTYPCLAVSHSERPRFSAPSNSLFPSSSPSFFSPFVTFPFASPATAEERKLCLQHQVMEAGWFVRDRKRRRLQADDSEVYRKFHFV